MLSSKVAIRWRLPPAEVAALCADPCDRAPAQDSWHALPAGDVLQRLAVCAEQGLTGEQIEARHRLHGANALPEAPPPPAWRLFARQFASPLIYILFAAALMAMALGHHGDAGVILAVVLANALIGTFQEGRAERSMAALRRLAAVQVRVLRNGRESMVEARQLVPGDIVVLAAGDAVAADARLIEESQLQAAEAALTGESVPVSKFTVRLPEEASLADRRNMVYSGTYVTAGRALAVVVATGPHTEVGRIAGLTQGAAEPQTPLQQRIGQFGRVLVAAAFALFVLVVLLGVWRALPLAEVLMVAISQMVSMVPEGLPVAMTIALAVGMQRMAARGVIIRRLSAVETLGSTTVICSDKTGTLTRNEMTVTALWLPADGAQAARRIDVSGIGYWPEGELTEAGARVDPRAPALVSLLEAAVLCNDAQLLPPEDERDGWTVAGDPTEGALLVLAAKAGIGLEALRKLAPRDAELPFDSDAKLMATRHRMHAAPRRVIVKGAPEAVLRLCAGTSPEALLTAREAADAMAAQALRVLAFALVEDDPLDPAAGFDALDGRARLLGLAGQIDPPRDEAKVAVADCRAAGIRPVMVTGDHKLTGLAIARALGIAREGDRAIDGTELERMGEADLRAELPGIAVFARVQPAQKLRIVQALQARGEVVAMTGDGVNDAPALARADVGVAMGITGTEVAKSAARIVITDDNFATIVRAVEQGRIVYGNLKKVILYLFATSIDEVALLLLALLAGYPLPLAAVQILWINIVTEGTLTVNLVMQPADGDEMRRKPVPRDDALVDRGMLQRVALMALVTVTVTFGWFVWRIGTDTDLVQARTETFTLLAMCQWFNVLNCQSPIRSALGVGLLCNRWLLAGLAASVILQLAVIYVPAMSTLFHTVALPAAVVILLAVVASAVLVAEELRKLLARSSAELGSRSVY
jgi:magnesium-transporting ATPase (P-type)